MSFSFDAASRPRRSGIHPRLFRSRVTRKLQGLSNIPRKQLEILNHFGTIDFDPDYDPIKLRNLDRTRMNQQ
jgi:hypothetical protein